MLYINGCCSLRWREREVYRHKSLNHDLIHTFGCLAACSQESDSHMQVHSIPGESYATHHSARTVYRWYLCGLVHQNPFKWKNCLRGSEWVAAFTDSSEFCGQWQSDEQSTFMMTSNLSKPLQALSWPFFSRCCFWPLAETVSALSKTPAVSIFTWRAQWWESGEQRHLLFSGSAQCDFSFFLHPLHLRNQFRVL